MFKPELVISNTTTFFSGNLENIFKKAKKNGFKYLEILPYRWTTPAEVLNLEKKYNIQVVGIHLPPAAAQKGFLNKVLSPIWPFYLGSIIGNPALTLVEIFKKMEHDFYIVSHADLIEEILQNLPNLLMENIPYYKNTDPVFWDPIKIKKLYPSAKFAFDPGHFETTPNYPSQLLETYQTVKPEVVHISYGNFPPHVLPNQKEQEELKAMLKIHSPKYIVLETNPLVSVKKGKEILEKLINPF